MKVIEHWQAQSKSKRPDCKSYTNLSDHYQDKFILAKMQFLKDIAKKLNVFLTRFQTNNPMLSFLSDALVEMFTSLIFSHEYGYQTKCFEGYKHSTKISQN